MNNYALSQAVLRGLRTHGRSFHTTTTRQHLRAGCGCECADCSAVRAPSRAPLLSVYEADDEAAGMVPPSAQPPAINAQVAIELAERNASDFDRSWRAATERTYRDVSGLVVNQASDPEAAGIVPMSAADLIAPYRKAGR